MIENVIRAEGFDNVLNLIRRINVDGLRKDFYEAFNTIFWEGLRIDKLIDILLSIFYPKEMYQQDPVLYIESFIYVYKHHSNFSLISNNKYALMIDVLSDSNDSLDYFPDPSPDELLSDLSIAIVAIYYALDDDIDSLKKVIKYINSNYEYIKNILMVNTDVDSYNNGAYDIGQLVFFAEQVIENSKEEVVL